MTINFAFMFFFLFKSKYQSIIDATKASISTRATILSQDSSEIKFPGHYYEKGVSYSVDKPVFTIDSSIALGLHYSDGMLGIIPSDADFFQKMGNNFALVNPHDQTVYEASDLLDHSENVFIFSARLQSISNIFSLDFLDFTNKGSKDLGILGTKIFWDISSYPSRKENSFDLSFSFHYNTTGGLNFDLDNILPGGWPSSIPAGYQYILDKIGLGSLISANLRITGVTEGTIEVTPEFLIGIGLILDLQRTISDRKDIKIFEYNFFGATFDVMGMEIGFKIGIILNAFFEKFSLTVPKLKALAGLHSKVSIVFDYSFKDGQKISNFRLINANKPEFIYKLTDLTDLEWSALLDFGLSLSAFNLQLGAPGLEAKLNLAFEFPMEFRLQSCSNCTKLVSYGADLGIKIVIKAEAGIGIKGTPLYKFSSQKFEKSLANFKDILKGCITDYTQEYKQTLEDYIDPPDSFSSEVYENFNFPSSSNDYTATFSNSQRKNGYLFYPISSYSTPDVLVIKITNGNIHNGKRLNKEYIYLIPISTNVKNGYVNITFSRRKRQPTQFHVYGIFATNINDFTCRHMYPLQSTWSSASPRMCIGNNLQSPLTQCCNDCSNKFCVQDFAKSIKLSDSHVLFYQPRENKFSSYSFHPYFSESFSMPNNTDFFIIPKDMLGFTASVFCDRCDSLLFLEEATSRLFSSLKGSGQVFTAIVNEFGESNKFPGLNNSVVAYPYCSSDEPAYCYSKCFSPEGYALVKYGNLNGISVISGDPSNAVESPFERESWYQIISNVPEEDYCSKTWEGGFEIIQQKLVKDDLTVSVIDKNDSFMEIKAYLGDQYIPFSRKKMYKDDETFFSNLGMNLDYRFNAKLLDDDFDAIHYGFLTENGSVQILRECFTETNLRPEYCFDIPDSYIKSLKIIHEEYTSKKPVNKKPIIVVSVVLSVLVLVGIAIFVIMYVKRKVMLKDESEEDGQLKETLTF